MWFCLQYAGSKSKAFRFYKTNGGIFLLKTFFSLVTKKTPKQTDKHKWPTTAKKPNPKNPNKKQIKKQKPLKIVSN